MSLHRKFDEADEQTFFSEGKRSHQLDYLFADQTVAEAVTACHVVPRERVEPYSDHVPLVAEFQAGPADSEMLTGAADV